MEHIAITGTSEGIGLELAKHFTDQGHAVYGCARKKSNLGHPGYHHCLVDISIDSKVSEWVSFIERRTPTLTALINNAWIFGGKGTFVNGDLKMWEDTIQNNIMGTIQVTYRILPLLRSPKRSTIINIGSIMGKFGRAGWGPYSVTKHALEGFTQYLAQELAVHGISVINLHPSRIRTSLRRQAYPEEEIDYPKNIESLLRSVDIILRLDHPHGLSGLSLSCNDHRFWGNV